MLVETTLGDITIDLHIEQCPKTTTNFLKLCKAKYYNGIHFHNIQKDHSIQTGDPTNTGNGGFFLFLFFSFLFFSFLFFSFLFFSFLFFFFFFFSFLLSFLSSFLSFFSLLFSLPHFSLFTLGTSVFGLIGGEKYRYFDDEIQKKLKHNLVCISPLLIPILSSSYSHTHQTERSGFHGFYWKKPK